MHKLCIGSIGLLVFMNLTGCTAEPSSQGEIIVEKPLLSLGIVEVGRDIEIPVLVTNQGNRSYRVIGCNNSCGPNWCLGCRLPGPVSIPPGQSATCMFHMVVHEVGSFQAAAELLVETANGIGSAPVRVSGEALQTAGPK